MAATRQAPRVPQADEVHFTPGAGLTLALAVALLLWPLAVTLAGSARPTDGWTHTSDPTNPTAWTST